MNKIRIQGLVKYANRIKDELCEPLTAERLTKLKKTVKTSLESLDKVLKEAKTTYDKLPPQTRKAYEFLQGINFDTIDTSEQSSERKFRPGSISFSRINGYFEHMLNQLALETKEDKLEYIQTSIRNSSSNLEKQLQEQNIAPEHLKSASREIRGWLAYFSDSGNFNEYRAAVQRAISIFNTHKANGKQTLIHFCPIKAIYRARSRGNTVIIKLPTPMISFGDNDFRHIAAMIFDRQTRKKELHAAIFSEPCQRIMQELELLGGMIERTKGIYYDLVEAFQRVNTKYFSESLSRPKLAWSSTFNFRKFGHYDHIHDTVMVNSVLDNSTTSRYTIDFIMYHELLHKKLKVKWQSKNMISHSPEFRFEENKFEQIAEAKKELNGFATTKQ
jgi:hypothetical protein